MKNGCKFHVALSAVATAVCALLVIGGLGYLLRDRWILPAGPDPVPPSRQEVAPPSTVKPPRVPASSAPTEPVPSPAPEILPTPEVTPSPEPFVPPAPDPNVPYQSLYPELYTAPCPQNEDKPGTIYLTIDDGPSKYTATVLDVLKQHGLKATFFVVTGNGELPDWKAELMQRIVNEGHTLGLHSATHDFRQIYASVEAFLEDFQIASDRIYGATGTRPWVFRFPGGTKNSYNRETYPEIVEEMNRRGFVHYDWNCSAQDASNAATSESIWQNMRANLSKERRNVLLMHDTKRLTVELLDAFLTQMETEGYSFEAIQPETKPVNWY